MPCFMFTKRTQKHINLSTAMMARVTAQVPEMTNSYSRGSQTATRIRIT